MKTFKFTTIALFALLMVSCNPDKGKLVKEISDNEKELSTGATATPEKTKIKSIIALYEKFVTTFPKDSLAPIYIYSAANLSMNAGLYEDAINFLDRLATDYTGFKKLPEAYFLKAFIYDDKIKNLDKARKAYIDFIQKFPKHDLVNDARISMDNLGKTPEQIVKEFEIKVKQKSDSAEAAAKKK